MLKGNESFSKSQNPLIEDCRLNIEDLRSASGGINYYKQIINKAERSDIYKSSIFGLQY